MAGTDSVLVPPQPDVGTPAPLGPDPESSGTSSQIIRMAAALMSAQVVSWVITVLGLLVVPRYLGTHDFGVLATASAVGIFALTVASLGTTNHLVKEVARRPDRSAELLGSALVLRLAAWLVLAAVVVPTVVLVVESATVRAAVLILFVGTAFDLWKTAGTAALQARYALGRTAIVQASIGLAAQLVIVALLIVGLRLGGVVLTLLAASIVSGGVTVFVCWRRFGFDLPLRREPLRAMLVGSAVYVGWDLAYMIFERVDVLMLTLMSGATSTGYYAFALKLSAVPTFVPAIVAGTVFPSLATTSAKDPDRFREVLRRSTHILVVATLPMAAGILLLASDLTRLIGGTEFLPSAPVVMVMAAVIPLIGIDTLLGTALFSIDRQRAWTLVAWLAAVVNPALNLAAIPMAERLWENAALGAAMATAATECLMATAAIWLLGSAVDRSATLVLVARTLLACAAMAVPVLMVRTLVGPLAAIPAGAVTYGLAAVLLGLLRRDDMELLWRALRRGNAAPSSQVSTPA